MLPVFQNQTGDMSHKRVFGSLCRSAIAEADLRNDSAIPPFDSPAASALAAIAAALRAIDRPILHGDCQVAAIARANGAAVATRNFKGFDGCGIGVINPWDAE